MALRDWILRDHRVATATTATVATVEPEKLASVAVVATVAVADCQTPIMNADVFVERTAIIEANGIPKEWAEGYATLCTMSRPAAYAPERWQQLVDDGECFLDHWGRQAAALGWLALDVFGVDSVVPETVYRCMGLVPLLTGRTVSFITDESARIDCGNGVTQSFRRHASSFGAVPLWYLERSP